MLIPLTTRQRQILDYINKFIVTKGHAPSLEEIGRAHGLSSLATVHKHLENLKRKHYIRRAWNRSRHIEVVTSGHTCPTCGQSMQVEDKAKVPYVHEAKAW